VKISWIFDVISPFTYLSLKQLPQLPKDVEVEFVPVLFAGLLNHFGHVGNAEIPTKRRFTYRYVLWRARKMGVPMKMPPAHPFNPLLALRLIVAAGSHASAVEAVFDAIWRDGKDIESDAVIADLAKRLDLSNASDALQSPEIKQKLRANTDRAIALGVFGVPTFVVGEELFWGHDAFEMLLQYLREPALFADEEMKRIDRLPSTAGRLRQK